MANSVLILGGGFGGVSAATRLRELAPDAEITLVDRRSHFMMGFRKTMEVVGREPMEAGRRPLKALEAKGVRVVQADITAIDPTARAAEFGGERVEADALIVALGADTAPGAIPGLAEHGINFYDSAEVPRAAQALASLKTGRLAIGIFGVPYKCAPAPYEMALLAREVVPSVVTVTAFTPQPMSLPVLGKAGCESVESRLSGAGVEFLTDSKAERVEPGRVVLAGGGEIAFDVLLGVPPHRVPKVVVDAGLAEPGAWVKVKPRTLETSFEGVYAIGDVVGIPTATKQPIPKAGVFADSEGRVVAERIAAHLAGREPETVFDGEGYCFLEIGGGMAQYVRGNFLAEPEPEVVLTPPSAESLAEKGRYERDRLDGWFGPAA